MTDERIEIIRELIRDVPDFPKPGILFKDITPLLADSTGFRLCIGLLEERLDDPDIDFVVGIESRGFIFGAALAARIGAGFVPARKPGKLPATTERIEYELEYGTDAVEMHRDALPEGARVVVVDDLIATGGTAQATGALIRKLGAEVSAFAFVVGLNELGGAQKLGTTRHFSLLEY